MRNTRGLHALEPSCSQARQAFVVEQLDHRSPTQPWEEQSLVDKRATPAELAACKLDFAAWLKRLSHVKRQLALRLTAGDTAREAAMQFRLPDKSWP